VGFHRVKTDLRLHPALVEDACFWPDGSEERSAHDEKAAYRVIVPDMPLRLVLFSR
jgi:hypothetical protein